MLSVSTLRPGYLVSLKTAVVGNVSYKKQDIEQDHVTPDGALQARWETERTIRDPEEHKVAIQTRSRCRTIVTSVCTMSDFGLLCPETSFDRLGVAVQEARDLAAEFNRTSSLSQIQVYVITGRVAPDDVEAVRAINSELRGLLADMERGLTTLDVRVVREAANKAKGMASMLSVEASERVKTAISAARSAARRIVKAGEEGVAEIDRAAIAKIATSRAAFLDLEEGHELIVPDAVGRAVDLMPQDEDDEREVVPPAPVAVTLDIEPEKLAASTEEHTPLCQCAACTEAYGDTVAVPTLTARSIDLD